MAVSVTYVEIYSFNSPFGHCVVNPGNESNFEIELDKNINRLLKLI